MKKINFKRLFVVLIFLLTFTLLNVNNFKKLKVKATTTDNISLSIDFKNLSYSDSLYLKYYVKYTGFDPNTNKVLMLFWNTTQQDLNSYTLATAELTKETNGLYNYNNFDYLEYNSRGIAAKEMADEIYARAYVKIGENEYYSDILRYSIVEYVYQMRTKKALTPIQEEHFTNMLKYGASAQKLLIYHENKLATDTFVNVTLLNSTFDNGFDNGFLKQGTKHHINFTGDLEMHPEYETLVTKDELGEYYFTVPTDKTEFTLDLKFHNWNVDYSFDENEHWIECGNCGLTKERGPHTPNNESICTVCGKELATEGLQYSLSLDGTYYKVTGYTGTLTTVRIPSKYKGLPVKEIADNAFAKYAIVNVYIAEGVEKIGKAAFQECRQLVVASIPTSVKEIGSFAFNYCESLTTTNLPEGITTIEESTFYFCTKLNSIKIPTSVTHIGIRAFWGTGLTSLEIPESVTSYGIHAFDNCDALTYVKIPGTAETLAEGLFYDCDNLKKVEICEGVKVLEASVFYGCNNLREVILPKTITNINADVFDFYDKVESVYYCGTSLQWKKITLGENQGLDKASIYFYSQEKPGIKGNYWYYDENNVIQKWLYSDSTNLAFKEYYGSYAVKGIGTCTDTNIVIPATYNNLPVMSIEPNAFKNNTNIKSVYLPDSVNYINEYAFEGCTNLTDFHMTNGVESIGEYAFNNCINLTNINLSQSINIIESHTFAGCAALKHVEISSKVTSIGFCAFENCGLTELDIPNSVTSIGSYAFSGLKNITSVVISGHVTTFNSNVFSNCDKLEFVRIVGSNTPTDIYSNAFANCPSLKRIILPKLISQISSDAFLNDSALEIVYYSGLEADWNKINILANNECLVNAKRYYHTTSTVHEADKYWSMLSDGSIVIEDVSDGFNYEYLPNGTYKVTGYNDRYAIGSLYIPSHHNGKLVTVVGRSAFSDHGVSHLYIPETIKIIEEYAFDTNRIKTIQFDSGDITIGSSAFYMCYYFKDVYFKGTPQQWDKIANHLPANPTVSYYSETKPTANGSYWHYDTDGITRRLWYADNLFEYEKFETSYYALHYIGGDNINLVIPESFNGLPVSGIKSDIFEKGYTFNILDLGNNFTRLYCSLNGASIEHLIIGDKVNYIDSEFDHYTRIGGVYFRGTKEQWNKITFDEDSDGIGFLDRNRPTYYNYDGCVHQTEFESNGGTIFNPLRSDFCINLPKPTKTDYYFDGWFDNPEFTGDQYLKTYYGGKDIKLYAKWITKQEYLKGTSFDNPYELILGQTFEIKKREDNITLFYFKFVVTEAKTSYTFTTDGDDDTYGRIYNSNRVQIEENDDRNYDRDHYDFQIITDKLVQGNTYYLTVDIPSYSEYITVRTY